VTLQVQEIDVPGLQHNAQPVVTQRAIHDLLRDLAIGVRGPAELDAHRSHHTRRRRVEVCRRTTPEVSAITAA